MNTYRRHITSRWDDIDGLSKATRLLHAYLCTGHLTSRLGMVRATTRRLAASADLTREEVEQGLLELADRDLLTQDDDRGSTVLYLRGHIETFGAYASPNEKKSWRRELEAMPWSEPRNRALRELSAWDGGKPPSEPSAPGTPPAPMASATPSEGYPKASAPSASAGSPIDTPAEGSRYPIERVSEGSGKGIDRVPEPHQYPIGTRHGHGQEHVQGQSPPKGGQGAREAAPPSRPAPDAPKARSKPRAKRNAKTPVSRNPPTREAVEQIMQYTISREGLPVSAKTESEKFMDYYTSNGWKTGRNPVVDWPGTARNWVRREAKGWSGGGSARNKRAAAVEANARRIEASATAPAGVHKVKK